MEPHAGDDKQTYGQRFERSRPDAAAGAAMAAAIPAVPVAAAPAAPAGPVAPGGAGGPASPGSPAAPGPAAPSAPSPPAAGEPSPPPPPAHGAGEFMLTGVLYFLAAGVGLLGVVGGLYTLSQAAMRGLTGADWLAVMVWLVCGLGLAGLLAGCGGLLSLIARQRRDWAGVQGELADLGGRVDRLAVQPAPPPPAAPAQFDPAILRNLSDRLDQLADAIDGIAADCLLDEAGREGKRRQVFAQQRVATVERVRSEMAAGQWDRAQAAIDRLRASYPADPDPANRLAEELNRRRGQAESEDVATARRQCEELMSVSAWERAGDAAMGLIAKHPESTAAKALVARVDRERKVAGEQQRQALYGQIQRHTSRREWKEAVAAARRLIGQFPNSIEAEAVNAQMDTLSANAEVLHRQGMEASIKDLVKRRRYEEAVAVAEELITAYPNSPQAGVLRGTIEQLRGKAAEEAAETRKRRVQWQ